MADDLDITADLIGGPNDAGLADNVQQISGADASVNVPDGTVQQNASPAKAGEPAVAAEADPNVSLRNQLSSAFKGEDGKPGEQAAAPSVAPTAAPVLSKDGDGKYRLADGTFASTEQITAFEAAAAAPAAQPQYQNVLTGFTPAEQQQFQSLPAELQQLVGRTMEGLNARGARYGEYDLIEQQILGPRRQALAANGTSVPIALNQLFALSDFAGKEPGNFVLWFSQQNNLDLDELLDQQEAKTSVDPTVQNLQNTVQQLQGTLQQQQQADQQRQHQARLEAVQTFASEKDGAGSLKRPHLTDVMDDWATQITVLRTAQPNLSNDEVLQKAYEAACWASPAVRAKMQAVLEEGRRKEQATQVQNAKAAGSSVHGAPAGTAASNSNNPNRSLRDELVEQFAAQAV